MKGIILTLAEPYDRIGQIKTTYVACGKIFLRLENIEMVIEDKDKGICRIEIIPRHYHSVCVMDTFDSIMDQIQGAALQEERQLPKMNVRFMDLAGNELSEEEVERSTKILRGLNASV